MSEEDLRNVQSVLRQLASLYPRPLSLRTPAQMAQDAQSDEELHRMAVTHVERALQYTGATRLSQPPALNGLYDQEAKLRRVSRKLSQLGNFREFPQPEDLLSAKDIAQLAGYDTEYLRDRTGENLHKALHAVMAIRPDV